jgi:predicted cupin superfamily sugar epimerase
MIPPEAAALIEHYAMTTLPIEGTSFVSTWRSTEEFDSGDPVGTSMIGLYVAGVSSSLFHRLRADEVWHHYGGDPLRLVLLLPDGSDRDVLLGPDWRTGQHVQFVIPKGVWQAGEVAPGGAHGWSLFGCTMAPGFTGASFEGGRTADLLQGWPQRQTDIERLGVPGDHGTRMPDGFAT